MFLISKIHRLYVAIIAVVILLIGVGFYLFASFWSPTVSSTLKPVGMVGNETIYSSDIQIKSGGIFGFLDQQSAWNDAVQQSLKLQYGQAIGFIVLDESFYNSANKDLKLRSTKLLQINDRMSDPGRLVNFTIHTMNFSLPIDASESEQSSKRAQTEQLLRTYIETYRKDPASIGPIIAEAAKLDPSNSNRPLSLPVDEHNPFLPSIYTPYFGFLSSANEGGISQAYPSTVVNDQNNFQEGVNIIQVTKVIDQSNRKMEDFFKENSKSVTVTKYAL